MSDLQAARERLRAVRAKRDKYEPVSDDELIQSFRDENDCLDAYLAEHPADDDEPITFEWLEKIGGIPVPLSVEVHDYNFSLPGIVLNICYESRTDRWIIKLSQYERGISLGEIKTRGQVRRLIEALRGND